VLDYQCDACKILMSQMLRAEFYKSNQAHLRWNCTAVKNLWERRVRHSVGEKTRSNIPVVRHMWRVRSHISAQKLFPVGLAIAWAAHFRSNDIYYHWAGNRFFVWIARLSREDFVFEMSNTSNWSVNCKLLRKRFDVWTKDNNHNGFDTLSEPKKKNWLLGRESAIELFD
jgi:hypothetical protein